MTPTCSQYSMQAIEKHGFFMGALMTVDRLIREIDEKERSPWIDVNGEDRLYDPIHANDFWWDHQASLDK